jgi:putative ABC transport system permease protein
VVEVLKLRISLFDLRLGVRMLARYPVLTLVGTASLAFAIAIGAAAFAFISLMLWPSLPLPEGDRVVSVRLHDESTNEDEDRLTADFLRWREATTSLTDFGAGRRFNRNLTMGDGVVEPVDVAEVTASTFSMARVSTIAGRPLLDADAAPSALPVMVIGEHLWRSRFGGDPSILQQPITLAGRRTAVVGIMPDGFKFPSVYEVWVPLRLDATAAPRTGTGLRVWARMKPGVSLEQAAAEFEVFRAAAAADWPSTHAHLHAEVKPFAISNSGLGPVERMMLASVNLAIGVLVVLISGNVALLMFARAATRESEILVRTALGASRGQLIRQFFAEALVLSAPAAILGLLLARKTVEWALQASIVAGFSNRSLPFWLVPRLPPLSIAYGCGLALFAAIVTGVLPALKVTRGLSSRLRQAGAGGGGLKFGGVWTALIIAQIALTVTFPVIAHLGRLGTMRMAATPIGVPPRQVLSAQLGRDVDLPPVRYEAAVRQVRNALAAMPGVGRVTIADRLPLMEHGHSVIGVDAGGAGPMEGQFDGYRVSTAAVAEDFFATFDAAPLAGRLLTAGDYAGPPRVAVVNQSFVDRVLGGRNPIGRHVQYRVVRGDAGSQRPPTGANPPWIEIVGLVRDMGMAFDPDPQAAGLYLPLNLSRAPAVYVAARVSGDVAATATALRHMAARTEPLLRVLDVQPLDQAIAGELREDRFWTRLIEGVSASTLLLALSGIYAVTSFTVSRRTREIGIRVALGSSRLRVVFAILRGPLVRMAIGIAVGCVLITLLSNLAGVMASQAATLVGYLAVMCVVCLLACLVPARRAMAVDPIEALRAE